MNLTPYLPREIASPVADALRSLPAAVVTGLRQAGKTTFLRRDPLFADADYVTLDDFDALAEARRDPARFVSRSRLLIVDEVQRLPELLVAVKREIDLRRRPGRFVLSGSANLALMSGASESLAGRTSVHVLRPMTRRELRGETSAAPALLRLWNDGAPTQATRPAPTVEDDDVLAGGVPPAALGTAEARPAWFRGYESTYVERDVRDFARIADLAAFRIFLRLAAARGAQLLNVANLARDAKVSTHLANRWLGVLEASHLLRRLPPELSSRTSRLIKAPKLYVEDSGLAGALLDAGPEDVAADGAVRGALYETYVAQQLASIVENVLPTARLGFWHVHGRHEVDFVLADRKRLIGVEVKADARLRDAHCAGLEAFLRNEPRATAAVLAYSGTETLRLGDRLWAVPIGLLVS